MQIDLGIINVTKGAAELPKEWILKALALFSQANWGDHESIEDIITNDWVAEHGGFRLHGTYNFPSATIWVIRNVDGRSTTVLLPDEY